MNDTRIADRRMMLAALSGTALVATMGGTSNAEEPKADKYGFSIETTDPKKEEMCLKEKPKEPEKTASIEVLKYDLIGGPIIFHGQVWVDKTDNNKTITLGEVSKGPPPFHGMFEGFYFLTKDKPNAFFFDDPTNPRHGLQVKLDLGTAVSYVVFRTGYKRVILPGWVWGSWHVLKAW